MSSLFRLRPDELVAASEGWGTPCTEAEARRVLAWVVSHGRTDLDAMKRPVRRDLRAALQAHASTARPVVLERVADPVDDAVRYLFQADDGALFEVVRIGLHKPGHYTLCLSSQAGCAMACAFCATGRLGLGRHLRAEEIVASFCTVRDEAPGRVSGAVFMGQGEPLHNEAEVLRAAATLVHPCGGRIGRKALTISTVGLVPQIRRYTAAGHPYRLIVSLSSAVQARRAELLPVAARWTVAELAAAVRAHFEATGRPVTLAWVLMGGVNHGPDEVAALSEHFGPRAGEAPWVKVNLIDVNDTAARDGRTRTFRRADEAERSAFHDALSAAGFPVIRRYSVGRSEDAACGMLASRRRGSGPPTPGSGADFTQSSQTSPL